MLPARIQSACRCLVAAHLLALLCSLSACGFDLGASDDAKPGPSVTVSCDALSDWDPAWAAFEDEVLRLCNEARAQGHDCDSEGNFGPAAPLSMEPRLRCAARQHTAYMAETGDFDHTEARSGTDPFQRIESTGYRFSTAGENIAVGQQTPADVVAGWLESDGHCANIMSPDYEDLGVGYAVGTGAPIGSSEAPYWTQAFATQF